jgi:dihydrofolate synthase / folylpolyglutamate synthase
MPDHAISSDPAVQTQLNRLTMLSPGRDVLGLERISELLKRLGNPHLKLPPVFHVAGTNGKGSTCAFLRAALEAAGRSVHVYSSPHLVRFNERIRIAGKLIEDSALAPLLSEVLDCSEDLAPSFFEATTAVAFLSFARTPADAAVIEVGLGGRLDATNIIPQPAVCGVASLGIDHENFLLDPDNGPAYPPLERIAYEKAGIAKTGVPLVTMDYAPDVAARVEQIAAEKCCAFYPKGSVWDAVSYNNKLHYRDMSGKLKLPLPAMHGAHQAMNAALAIAMIRHQSVIEVPEAALKAGMGWAHWPARLQRLAPGPFAENREVWLDGGHNADCGIAIAAHFRETLKPGQSVHLICGILSNKDARGVITSFADLVSEMTAVPVPGHPHHEPKALAAIAAGSGINCRPAATIEVAMRASDADVTIILGSLYLAGEVLRANNQVPD